MSWREWVYGALAVLGAAAPWWFNTQWMLGAEDAGLIAFVSGALVTGPSTSIAVDIAVACATFFVWMMVEARRLKMRWAWLLIPYALVVAFASAFPLFLLLRERRLRAGADTAPGATAPSAAPSTP